MEENKKQELIRKHLDAIENNARSLKKLLLGSDFADNANLFFDNTQEGITGIYDGENLIDSNGKSYLVSSNYASKSKLLPGDALKLTVTPEGEFRFKQIQPVERKSLVGEVYISDGKYFAKADDKNYQILLASATYYKLNHGDKVTILIPKNSESVYAAVENKIE